MGTVMSLVSLMFISLHIGMSVRVVLIGKVGN